MLWCSEADEIYKICCVIGSPTYGEWAEGLKLACTINYQFPQVSALACFFSKIDILPLLLLEILHWKCCFYGCGGSYSVRVPFSSLNFKLLWIFVSTPKEVNLQYVLPFICFNIIWVMCLPSFRWFYLITNTVSLLESFSVIFFL